MPPYNIALHIKITAVQLRLFEKLFKIAIQNPTWLKTGYAYVYPLNLQAKAKLVHTRF